MSYSESVNVGYSRVVAGINLDFDPPGVEEPQPMAHSSQSAATIVRGLRAGMPVFDAMGRIVANPRSGIYFVREAHAQAQAVRKVIIQR